MEQGLGSESNPRSNAIDRSMVLEVKPLRCLVPAFPNPPGTSSLPSSHGVPFSCIPPCGPFPSGIHPFYPFVFPNDSRSVEHGAKRQQGNFGYDDTIPSPVHLNSKTPSSRDNGSTVKLTNTLGKRRKVVRKRVRNGDDVGVESIAKSLLKAFNLHELDDLRRSNGDKDTVGTILLVYNLLRKRLTQLVEASDFTKGVSKQPSLKACRLLMSKGCRTNSMKRIGHVPGIEIGDIFFYRMELCIVGLHAQSMSGIDYMSFKITGDEEPLAVSIVSSGGYDDEDGRDVLIYSGQGGLQGKDGQMFDQKLEKGNLSLAKSIHRANDVRVIRGIKDSFSTGKVYVYDGLYKIQESWAEKNKSGCNVFKYKFVRVPGQPEAYSLWKTIQQWKDGTAPRMGMILSDLTSGAESQPVSLVNDVDAEKGPSDFTYISGLRYSKPSLASKPSPGCECASGCQPGDTNCPCHQRNDGFLPYSSMGILMTNKSMLYECGQNCTCPPNCRNRTSQAGIKVRLEVFKTKNKGWGLRSWDPIREGAFICEYAGDAINDTVEFGNLSDDNYVFNATRHYEPLESVGKDSARYKKVPYPLVINAKNSGNVARFMNHSCSPNVYWQAVLRECGNDSYLHISFFAIRHIPPMQEITYNYGSVSPEKGNVRKKCLCESVKCMGYFF